MPTSTSEWAYAPCDRCGDRYRVQGLTRSAEGQRLCFLCARGLTVPLRWRPVRPGPRGPGGPQPLRWWSTAGGLNRPAVLQALAARLQAASAAGQADLDADALYAACRGVVPQEERAHAHAWTLAVAIRAVYERSHARRQGRYRVPALLEAIETLARG